MSTPNEAVVVQRDVKAVAIPAGIEVNLKLGYQFTTWLRGYVGYDALELNHVARAGDSTVLTSYNTAVSVAGSTNTVSLSQPTFAFSQHDVLVQGLTFGFEVTY